MIIREYNDKDLNEMSEIWNEIVMEANAFPQEQLLNKITAPEFFKRQSYCGVAVENDSVLGLYILHPNNIGRCGHIANASYAVKSECRGKHIGEELVKNSLIKAKELGFKLMQFNAVVENNTYARKLYEKLGFKLLGIMPDGFKMGEGHFENICLYYIEL